MPVQQAIGGLVGSISFVNFATPDLELGNDENIFADNVDGRRF